MPCALDVKRHCFEPRPRREGTPWRSHLRHVALILTLGQTIAIVGPAAQQSAPARPIEPITALLDAFRSHQLVALGEPHGNEQAHAFRLALIRDPRFATVVNDIVVESGSALHQDLMDRFIRCENMPMAAIRPAWQDTTQHLAWDTPIYEEFFRTVRELNATLPVQRRIRVLLGDPPIEWNDVRTPQDHFRWMRLRDSFPADLIQREVLARQRRALLIYGDNHLQRRIREINYEPSSDPQFNTLVSLLTRRGTAVFTVSTPTNVDLSTLQADVASWPRPSLALTQGTTLGAAEFSAFFGPEAGRAAVRDGKLVPIPRAEWGRLELQEQFDAVLYLGPPSALTSAQLPAALCADQDRLRVRRQRFLAAGAKGALETLAKVCALELAQ